MLRLNSKLRHLLAAGLVSSAIASAQITGLCNTGETKATSSGCTGILVTPAPPRTNTSYDGNWSVVYFPFASRTVPTSEKGVAWVTFPNPSWLPNGTSSLSEWITPYAGGNADLADGYYIFRTTFPVPAQLPNGSVPVSVSVSGRLSSDNGTGAIFLECPAGSGQVVRVTGPLTPVSNVESFERWYQFSFSGAITAGVDAAIYIAVLNVPNSNTPHGGSPTGLRVEFDSSSAIQ